MDSLGDREDEARLRAHARFQLARLLVETSGGRIRAMDLAARARATLVGFGSAHASDVADIDRWLASTPPL